MYNVYLAHHGIKGQKWGRRRWQRPDGSLTPEGYRHYYGNNPNARMTRSGVVDSKTGKMLYQNPTRAQRKQNKEAYRAEVRSHYGIDKAQNAYDKAVSNQKKVRKTGTVSDLSKANNEVKFRKRELSDTKAYASFKNQNKISKRQQKLIDSYKKQGLTQKEAEIAAYKRARAEKIALAALGTAAAAAAAYGAYKYADYAFDKKIGTKDTLYRVAQSGDKGVHDAFYAVFDKSGHDKARYNGLYAQQLIRGDYGQMIPHVYEKKIGVNSSIKVASQKHAKEILTKELLKNSESLSNFKDEFANGWAALFNPPALNADIDKFVKTGKMSNRLYEHINRNLANRNLETTKTFYKALKDAGYGAVKDVNDSKYSGFGTKLPLIVFDSLKTSVKEVNELDDYDRITKRANRVIREQVAKQYASDVLPTIGLYGGAATVSAGATSHAVSKWENRIVQQYRDDHPNSKLSKNEIIRNYYNDPW